MIRECHKFKVILKNSAGRVLRNEYHQTEEDAAAAARRIAESGECASLDIKSFVELHDESGFLMSGEFFSI